MHNITHIPDQINNFFNLGNGNPHMTMSVVLRAQRTDEEIAMLERAVLKAQSECGSCYGGEDA